MKTPSFLSDADASRASADVGSDRLDCLVADTVSNLQRLAELDLSSVTAADLAAELRDNLYPSLLSLTEELRALDDDVGELSAPESGLAPSDVLAIARAFRSAQMLAGSVREALVSMEPSETREALLTQVGNVDASVSLAAAVVHQLVVTEPTGEMHPKGSGSDVDAEPQEGPS